MKSITQSRTFWLAAAQIVAGIFMIIGQTPYAEIGVVAIAKSCLDIWIRLNTEKAIG